MVTFANLRRYAVARTIFDPLSLSAAIGRLGFVQADPIRAPARAQDLVLRHRVKDYRAGDLECRYPSLNIEEDYFVNYGFLPHANHVLLHPRDSRVVERATAVRRAEAVVDFVRANGSVHPRQVDAHFSHGKVTNAWGGISSAATSLLDDLHYRGRLRVARRDNGVRVYAVNPRGSNFTHVGTASERLDALIDLIVGKYAPLTLRGLRDLARGLRYGAPQFRDDINEALRRATRRLPHVRIDGNEWYWPAGEQPCSARDASGDRVLLLTPFDPLVWDRGRFALFWDWIYRFEAYMPPRNRKFGYYALPLLWRGDVLGWANVSVQQGELKARIGFADGHGPKSKVFQREVASELDRMRIFLQPRI